MQQCMPFHNASATLLRRSRHLIGADRRGSIVLRARRTGHWPRLSMRSASSQVMMENVLALWAVSHMSRHRVSLQAKACFSCSPHHDSSREAVFAGILVRASLHDIISSAVCARTVTSSAAAASGARASHHTTGRTLTTQDSEKLTNVLCHVCWAMFAKPR